MTSLVVVATGGQSLVEDLGRPGRLGIGIPPAGAVDPVSLRAANRLVGNPEDAAAIEVLLGGLAIRPDHTVVVAVTGAPAASTVDGRPVAFGRAVTVPAGATMALAAPLTGLRSYLAVRGGLDVPQVLGSRSADTSNGLGPAPLRPGDELPVGPAPDRPVAAADLTPVAPVSRRLTADLGPRDDLLTREAGQLLSQAHWRVSSRTDRIGVRLEGPHLMLTHDGELPSAPILPGAIQVPPSGQPIVFLNDHPITGGYPIVACVRAGDLGALAQARPGDEVRITLRTNRIR